MHCWLLLWKIWAMYVDFQIVAGRLRSACVHHLNTIGAIVKGYHNNKGILLIWQGSGGVWTGTPCAV